MTTIAYAAGVLAADTQLSGDTVDRTHKLARLPDGSLVGCAGDAWRCRALIEWLSAGQKGRRPALSQVDAQIVREDGVWQVDRAWPPIPVDEPTAIGSGALGAMVAMRLGCDAVQAVEAVCGVDPMTSGPVEFLRYPQKPKAKIRKSR